MKYSKQRELIMRTVKKSDTHPTAEQVYTQVKPLHPSISLGTVYRNLTQLSAQGQVRRLAMPNGSDRFDGRMDDHAHILCGACGRIFDIDLSFGNELDEQVKRETGVTVTEYQLVIVGVCQDCSQP